MLASQVTVRVAVKDYLLLHPKKEDLQGLLRVLLGSEFGILWQDLLGR
jgi:hypothetical protein